MAGKVFSGVAGIPTDEVPLYEQIQQASRDIVKKAIELERFAWPGEEGESQYLQQLLEAVRLYNSLVTRQDPSPPAGPE